VIEISIKALYNNLGNLLLKKISKMGIHCRSKDKSRVYCFLDTVYKSIQCTKVSINEVATIYRYNV